MVSFSLDYRLRNLVLGLAAFFIFMALLPFAAFADVEENATLEADVIRYDEEHNMAWAEGNVYLRYGTMEVRAGLLEMNTETGEINVYPEEDKLIGALYDGKLVQGTFLNYNLLERTGHMSGLVGSVPFEGGKVYIKSEMVDFETVAEAESKKLLSKKTASKHDPKDPVLATKRTSVTTCPQPTPHYMLFTKQLIVIPGGKMLVKAPRVYLGNTLIFTYPFDYLVQFESTPKNSFMPSVKYDSDKGVGISTEGSFYWETGQIDVEAALWTSEGFEGAVRVDQNISPWLSLYAGVGYLYDSDRNEKVERPYWGMLGKVNGWSVDLGWYQREKIEVRKRVGDRYESTVWRDPELIIRSPWYKLFSSDYDQYFRFGASWGRYQETGGAYSKDASDFIERRVWGVQYYTEFKAYVGAWRMSPFIKASYWNYSYDDDNDSSQKVTRAMVGVRMTNGRWTLGTAYERRWVSGESAFVGGWDSYDDAEVLYQRIEYKFNDVWSVAVQGGWDFDYDRLGEMLYMVRYDLDCYSLALTYFDDRVSSKSWASLSFALTINPDDKFVLGGEEVYNPFARPMGIPLYPDGQVTDMETPSPERGFFDAQDVYQPLDRRGAGTWDGNREDDSGL